MDLRDEPTFEALFTEYYAEMCRSIYPIVKDKTLAEDVVQDVFFNLWEKREQREIKGNPKAYLYRACILRALDHVRNPKHKPASGNAVPEVGQPFTEESVEHADLQHHLQAALDSIPEPTRSIFTLSRFSGLKNREIADHLDISPKTVEKHMGRALKLLRKALAPFLGFFLSLLLLAFITKIFPLA